MGFVINGGIEKIKNLWFYLVQKEEFPTAPFKVLLLFPHEKKTYFCGEMYKVMVQKTLFLSFKNL